MIKAKLNKWKSHFRLKKWPKNNKFYLQPTIHKEGNQDRPVNCLTANILKHVDYQIQLIDKEISSYVEGAQDFLKKLEKAKDTHEDSALVTSDIKPISVTTPTCPSLNCNRIRESTPSNTLLLRDILWNLAGASKTTQTFQGSFCSLWLSHC